jgi:hypothetical protein
VAELSDLYGGAHPAEKSASNWVHSLSLGVMEIHHRIPKRLLRLRQKADSIVIAQHVRYVTVNPTLALEGAPPTGIELIL